MPPGPFREAGLHLRCLGRPGLLLGTNLHSAVLVSAVQQKHLAVVAFTALSANRTASRSLLSAYLWSENADADQRHGLRASLSLLRSSRALGPDMISGGDRESVRITGPLFVDCEEFERLINEERYEEAVELYSGPFFHEWAVPGCEGFEDWARGRRSHYSNLFAAAARELCERLMSVGRAWSAVDLAVRVRDEEPLQLSRWRTLLEVRIACGDPVRASAEADSLELLAESEGIALDAATRAAIKRARSRPNGARQQESSHAFEGKLPALVGREREFGALSSAWQRATTSTQLTFVHVQAGPGLGKSRLLAEFALRLSAHRASVVHVQCEIGLRDIGFSVAGRLAHALSQEPAAVGLPTTTAGVLVGLDPSLGDVFRGVGPTFPPLHDAPRLRGTALRDLISVVSERRPLAILIDDEHWCDAESRATIETTLADLPPRSILIVTAGRSHSTLVRDDRAVVEPGPLSAAEVAEMCQSLAALPEEPWADVLVARLAEVSRGSPLVVQQALRLAVEADALRINEGEWECDDPTTLERQLAGDSILARRLSGLNPTDYQALLVVALVAQASHAESIELVLARQHGRSDAVIRLERNGFIERTGMHLRVAHDMLEERALRDADPDQMSTARALAIDVLESDLADNVQQLVTLGRLSIEAKDPRRYRGAFERYVRVRRAQGDLGSLRQLASAFSGPDAGAVANELVAALPSRGFRSRPWLLAGALTAATLVAWLLAPSRQPESVVDFYVPMSGGRTRVLRATPDVSTWNRAIPLPTEERRGFVEKPSLLGFAVERPHAREWAVDLQTVDSGGVDVGLLDANGMVRRLTNSPGEDYVGGWSPDGRYLLIATSRWSSEAHLRVAVLEPSTGSIRRLTQEDRPESQPLWSPDGTRIAYARDRQGPGDGRICVTDVLGRDLRCSPSQGARLYGLLAWTSPHSLLVVLDSATRLAVTEMDVDTWQLTALPKLRAPDVCSPSADHEWIACPPYVLHGARPNDARLVDNIENGAAVALWRSSGAGAHVVQSIAFDPGPDTLWIGVPNLVRVSATTPLGSRRLSAIVWSSSDTSVATIGPDGVVVGRRQGEVTITADAGGWRSTAKTFAVSERPAAALAVEAWDPGFMDRWHLFGEPLPTLVDRGGTRALLNNGDGRYFSGAASRSAIAAGESAGAEFEVGTAVTREQWQYLQVGLIAIDSVVLDRFDGRNSYLAQHAPDTRACIATYPRTEGVESLRYFAGVPTRLPAAAGSALPYVADGRRWRIRVQTFPDGRCGYAVNGVPLAISAMAGSMGTPMRAFTQGHSVGADILVFRVSTWAGVRNDIDWTRVLDIRDVPGLGPRAAGALRPLPP